MGKSMRHAFQGRLPSDLAFTETWPHQLLSETQPVPLPGHLALSAETLRVPLSDFLHPVTVWMQGSQHQLLRKWNRCRVSEAGKQDARTTLGRLG